MILPAFDILARSYPADENPDAVRLKIGGEIATMPPGTNTCAMRLSRALNYAGKVHEIPENGGILKLYTLKGGDHLNYLLRVSELTRYLYRRYGTPTVSVNYSPTETESVTPFLGKRGIICWHVTGWDDATGHYTLWNGQTGLYEGGEDYFSTQYFPRQVQVPPTRRNPTGIRTIRETGIDLWCC
ncbi:MAG TPA: T6SS effector amidase Tae4 family protein [Pseudacidobacterium sp.]|nr:T6SS effector amidase Tae4 family protein [Pseudacidobacterium sp.]